MKTTAVIFTHPPDYEIAALAAAALRRLGARVWLAVDAAHPMPEAPGCGLLRTTFRRCGNLNGMEATLGIIDTYALAARHDGAERVMKVDSDTIVTSLAWIDAPEHLVGCGHDIPPGQQLFGACYALRSSFLPALRQRVALNGTRASRAEDILIGNAAAELGSFRRHILHEENVFTPYHEKRPAAWHVHRFSAICVQRRGRHPGAREEVRRKMAALLAAF